MWEFASLILDGLVKYYVESCNSILLVCSAIVDSDKIYGIVVDDRLHFPLVADVE